MGFLFAGLGAVFASCKDLISKRLALKIDGTLSTFASFAFALPFYLVVYLTLLACGLEEFPLTFAFWGFVGLRALTDSLAEGLKMHAFSFGDISLIATFFSLSPIFLFIFSPLITGDPPKWHTGVSVATSVAGSVLLVLKPSDWKGGQMKGILLALIAGLFFALNSCFDRLAVQHGKPVASAFAMTALSALIVAPFTRFRNGGFEDLKKNQAGLWSRGFLELVFMVSKLMALQYLAAPQVVVIQRLSVFLSIIGGLLLFKEGDRLRRIAAGLLIVVGAVIVLIGEWYWG